MAEITGLKRLGFVGFSTLVWAVGAWAATGSTIAPSGVESSVTYQATVVMPAGLEVNRENLAHLIREQTKHLLGVFASTDFAAQLHVKPNGDLGLVGLGNVQNFRIVSTTAVDSGTEVTYQAIQKMLVSRRLVSPGQTRKIPLYFPHDPVRFYAKPCTDQTFPQKEYLFYYWNPFREECKVTLKGKNQVDQVVAQVTGLELPPAGARPQYQQLARQIKARGELHIALLFGFNESTSVRKDEGRVNFESVRAKLLADGFEVDRFRNIATGPFVELVRAAGPGRPPTRISLSLSVSDIANPVVFSRRAREAFETADIIIYEGHSGLGGNLDIEKLTRLSSADPQNPTPIRFPKMYQIIYFDSCDSYYFYTEPYSRAKRGAQAVDMVSNGLSSYFDSSRSDSLSLIRFFLEPNPSVTWLQILTAMEKPLPGFTYLTNVVPIRN